jgi:heat shock protein HslJ
MRTLFLTILAASAVLLAGCASTAGGDITGQTWHLTSITTIQRQDIVPAEAVASYTLTFNDDGTWNGQADCNQLSGTYTIEGEAILTIALGPSTMAACGEDSLSDRYVEALTTTTTYSIAENQMTLTLADNGELLYQSRT